MSDATLYPMRTHADSACNPFEHGTVIALKNPSRTPSRRDASTRAQFRQGMLDNDTQNLVHRAVRRPDHHVPLGERVRVDRDAVDRHFGNGPVLLAHGQLLERV